MQIFLSYAREDEAFVSTLATNLKTQGAHVWFDLADAAVTDHAAWENAVQDALAVSEVLLVVLSPAALAQRYIEIDWSSFLNLGRPVVVAIAERCEVPDDLRSRPRVDFSNVSFAEAFHRLQLLLIEESTRISSSKWYNTDGNDQP
ncbi:MAG: toll/interleukin-1 receptor domain-containing protein [Anaerolineales bacterium]|nr:toll/interleukin-1 receptor domain-containing protein [Anaerolineales bacterium]